MEEEKVYTIGKGKLLFKAAGQTNYRDLGNAPDFKLATGIEKKDHYSSREGTKTKDAQAVIQQTATGSCTLDDLLDDNLKDYIMSNAITSVAQTAGSITDQDVLAELDKWIDLGKKKLSSVVIEALPPADWQATHAYVLGDYVKPVVANTYRYECTVAGMSGAAEPTWPTTLGGTVTDGSVTWTCRKITYVLNTDYKLDTEAGLLMPLSTGEIKAAQSLHADFSHAAITMKRMDAAKVSAIYGDIYFVGNPPKGKILDVKGYVSLTPKGDLSFIGEDWSNLQFDMEFMSGYGYNGLYELFSRGKI
jgi:hypothetical protein